MKLIIDRSKWLRGEGSAKSKLLRASDGKMCCLGQFGLACGFTPDDLVDIASPDDSNGLGKTWKDKGNASFLFRNDGGNSLYVNRTDVCCTLMEKNDDYASDYYTEAERESRIAAIFAANGVTVTFIDGT
jgi:hypothetical protein